jgi:Zn-dependent membrane protease YugP
MFGFGFWDPTYIWMVMIPTTLLMMAAQLWVNSTYRRWSQRRNTYNLPGEEAAHRLLQSSGLPDVTVQGTRGQLSDHYDPRNQSLYLSQGVAQVPSIASLAIVAHEIGHAMQDRDGYAPMRIRAALVPAASVGSYLGWILIAIGLALNSLNVAWLGVLAMAAGVAFALATLPVELNASARARVLLNDSGLVTSDEERRGVSSMLNAAAFTYVAGLATAVLQLLYFVSLVGGLGGRRRS